MTGSGPLDALVLVSFGGPEGPDDVVPFLENVTAGRGIPRERLTEVGAHYHLFGGVSPINQQNRELMVALRVELDRSGIDLPLYWGNRNWHPMLADTLAEVAAAGHRRILAIVTSAFGSYSGCRQYSEDLDAAAREVGAPLQITKSRPYWNHPGFLDAMVERITEALGRLEPQRRRRARLVFTAHSVPSAWTATSPYVEQLQAASAWLATQTAPDLAWDLVYQSRSGPPRIPWLEPDVNDHLEGLAAAGVDTVVLVPLGFVSDHMEVVYDLDTEAAATAERLELTMVRARTVGTHPAFVAALRQLVEEALGVGPALAAIGKPWPSPCPARCCVRPVTKP